MNPKTALVVTWTIALILAGRLTYVVHQHHMSLFDTATIAMVATHTFVALFTNIFTRTAQR